eukprot:TRINITY_DN19336_c0_g1_i1.p1 TRINITY_DN19336_c0_g1~~TRINITY_DN19336_c0_g1_i1.p1  ORF type:complete len:393 (-),score=86.29 TRINITY_DN19336_c0_g1_i1:425-1603(-)
MPALPIATVGGKQPQEQAQGLVEAKAGTQLFFAALDSMLNDAETPEIPKDLPRKVSIKNTFINVDEDDDDDEDDDEPMAPMVVKTRTEPARRRLVTPSHGQEHESLLAVKSSSLPPRTLILDGTPTPYPPSDMPQFLMSPDNVGRELLGTALQLEAPLPSMGASLHGQLTGEGLPACTPCGWFHKPEGCQNGADCRRCHLCPEGETKARKKKKLARLKAAAAAEKEAATQASAVAAAVLAPGAACPVAAVAAQPVYLSPVMQVCGYAIPPQQMVPMFIPIQQPPAQVSDLRIPEQHSSMDVQKISVKNTFIDGFEEDDNSREEPGELPLHLKGAQTCTARLSEEVDSFGLPDMSSSAPTSMVYDATLTPDHQRGAAGFGTLSAQSNMYAGMR